MFAGGHAMTQIVLTPEQTAQWANAHGPVVVVTDCGQTVAKIDAPVTADSSIVTEDSSIANSYPAYCKTEEDRQRYLASTSRLPSYEDLVKTCIDPPADWKEEKWDR